MWARAALPSLLPPSGRRDLVRLADLPSAATVYPSWQRADPFWDALWPSGTGGATVTWAGRKEMEAWGQRFNRSRYWHRSHYFTYDRPDRVAGLAAMQMWRLLTSEQIACICSDVTWASSGWNRALLGGLGAGYCQFGRFALTSRVHSTHRLRVSPEPAGVPYLVRALPAGLEAAARKLTYPERMAISCGGRPWVTPTVYARHGLLATEASLRVAEHLGPAAVMGETLADAASLLGIESKRYADAVWVRPDGLVIAVELVASTTSTLEEKSAWWARVLAEHPYEPLVVLFLVAAPFNSNGRTWHKKAPTHVRAAARGSLEVIAGRAPERMAVAYWSDWFPRRGVASSDFLTMRVGRPTGDTPGAYWEPVDLLDPFAVPGPVASPVPANCAGLIGMPRWLVTARGSYERRGLWQAAGFLPALEGVLAGLGPLGGHPTVRARPPGKPVKGAVRGPGRWPAKLDGPVELFARQAELADVAR